MSVSKLESLPNEILIDILEKYINGVDILTAFAFQLNRRFDALIAQCQRLRFDFMRCHKDDFRLCIGLLPAYIEKIEELALSEQNTPGQIHAFFSFFPLFTSFKHLRALYLHINSEAVEPADVQAALYSLLKTNLDTLSIKITKAQRIFSSRDSIADLFRLRTLKKFSIICDSYRMNWALLTEVSSNIEYLTICGMRCSFKDLKYIFQCASGLKYLNIEVSPDNFYTIDEPKPLSKKNMILMSTLHTVIFNTGGDAQAIHNMLEPYLRGMPSLHRLEIKAYNAVFDAIAWETLLKTALPTLTYLKLKGSVTDLAEVDIHNLLESFQTLFWIKKKNFNIIIIGDRNSGLDWFSIDKLQNLGQYILNKPVVQWWTGPQRELNDNLSVMNKISILSLSNESSSLLQDHYFDNVNHLVVCELNSNLFELIKTHINCLSIRLLDISHLKQENNRISSLLACTRNITALRIKLNQLLDHQFTYLSEDNCLKFLDISADQHNFNKIEILTVAKLFPGIEHLIINTPNLQNVPMLQTYLPRLRSLTFEHMNSDYLLVDDDYEQNRSDENLRRETQFLFQREANRVTVWIDQAALQASYWQNIDTSSQRSTNHSIFTDTVERFSFFD